MVLYWTAETAKYGLLSTLSFSNNNSQSSKLCAECAKFQIRVDAGEPDEVGLIFMAAQHRLRQEYEDIFPIFPNMKERTAHGCTFCTFIRSSLLSELYKRKSRFSAHKGQAAKIILTGSMTEMVDHESTLSMYRSEEPHALEIEVHIKDDEWRAAILKYKIELQMSTGLYKKQ
jgi:hypothetical protein